MEKIGINESGLGVFKRVKNINNNNTQNNPISNNAQNISFGLSLKPRLLKSDIVDFSTKINKDATQNTNNIKEVVFKNLSKPQEFLAKKFAPIADFAKNVKNNITNAWNKLNSISIEDVISDVVNRSQEERIHKEVQALMKKPVSELESMLTEKAESVVA